MHEPVAINDNHKSKYRFSLVKRIVDTVIEDDPYLKPLAEEDFPFGYMGPYGKDRPAALKLTYMKMLCDSVARRYGDKIANVVRDALERKVYETPPRALGRRAGSVSGSLHQAARGAIRIVARQA